MRKIVACLAAAGLAAAPVTVNAQSAEALSIARASAPMLPGVNFFQDDDGESNHGGGSTAVILGVVLIVLIGVAAISGSGDPSSP